MSEVPDDIKEAIANIEAVTPAANADLDQTVARLKEFRDSDTFPHPHIGVAMFQIAELQGMKYGDLLSLTTFALLRLAGGIPTEPAGGDRA